MYQPQIIPLTLKIQSQYYENVYYTVFIQRVFPDTGPLSNILLGCSASVSCNINVKSIMLDDFEYAIFTLAYKQVNSKAKRNKLCLGAPHEANILYRKDLDGLLTQYIPKASLQIYDEFKPLLLNELDNKNDLLIGDTGIQCMFRFVDFNNGHNTFMLCPGAALSQLSTTIGLSIFEANSIEEVLDTIILDMSTIFTEQIISYSNLDNTSELLSDIQRYLRFSLYGGI